MLNKLGFHKVASDELKRVLRDATKNYHAKMRGTEQEASAAHRALLKAMVNLHKFRMGA